MVERARKNSALSRGRGNVVIVVVNGKGESGSDAKKQKGGD